MFLLLLFFRFERERYARGQPDTGCDGDDVVELLSQRQEDSSSHQPGHKLQQRVRLT